MSRRQRLPIRHETPLTHRDAMRLHVWRRAWQRFGIALHINDVLALERQITDGHAEWIMDQQRRHSTRVIYWVKRDKIRMVGVFDVGLWAMATILPGLGYIKGDQRD